jgi:hypothetical protein
LHRVDRSQFLRLVAEGLRNVPEVGDGVLHRTARVAMAEVLRSHPVARHAAAERTSKHDRQWVRRPTKRRRPAGTALTLPLSEKKPLSRRNLATTSTPASP